MRGQSCTLRCDNQVTIFGAGATSDDEWLSVSSADTDITSSLSMDV